MSDTSQGGVVVTPAPTTNQAAFTADPAAQQAAVYSTTTETFGPGVEPPRAVQEQQARAAAAAAQQAQGVHPQQAFIDQEALLNRIRSEVKDQHYTELNEMKQQLAALQAEREEAQRRAQEEADAAAAAAKAAEEDGMSAKKLVEVRTQELQSELEKVRQDLATRDALLEQERQYAALQDWRAQRLAADDVRQNVPPQMLGLIRGNTQEEIEASIAELTNVATSIAQEMAQVQQLAFQQAPGVSPRNPGALGSPTDLTAAPRPMSPEQIAALTPAEYAKLRGQLLPQARPQAF